MKPSWLEEEVPEIARDLESMGDGDLWDLHDTLTNMASRLALAGDHEKAKLVADHLIEVDGELSKRDDWE